MIIIIMKMMMIIITTIIITIMIIRRTIMANYLEGVLKHLHWEVREFIT